MIRWLISTLLASKIISLSSVIKIQSRTALCLPGKRRIRATHPDGAWPDPPAHQEAFSGLKRPSSLPREDVPSWSRPYNQLLISLRFGQASSRSRRKRDKVQRLRYSLAMRIVTRLRYLSRFDLQQSRSLPLYCVDTRLRVSFVEVHHVTCSGVETNVDEASRPRRGALRFILQTFQAMP
jgi:hypothetical protein